MGPKEKEPSKQIVSKEKNQRPILITIKWPIEADIPLNKTKI